MWYLSKYKMFDTSQIKTYPLSTRKNKVKYEHLILPKNSKQITFKLPQKTTDDIAMLARAIVVNRKEEKPVVLFTGAHLIKNGLGLLIIDLVKRGMLTLVAGNAATAIHDFELALIGQTSECVPDALSKGKFGMAYEFAYINSSLSIGNKYNLGFGESLGKMICDVDFRQEVLRAISCDGSPINFSHPEISVLATCYSYNIPVTIHAGIGVDVIDQHMSFNGQSKGGCSGRDFLIYVNEIMKLKDGGIFINVGSAVQGPEVFLKAVSMAANVGKPPNNIICADFDLRTFKPEQMCDDSSIAYYYRDQKSIVTRVPQAFNSTGLYIQGDQKQTIPFLYKMIVEFV